MAALWQVPPLKKDGLRLAFNKLNAHQKLDFVSNDNAARVGNGIPGKSKFFAAYFSVEVKSCAGISLRPRCNAAMNNIQCYFIGITGDGNITRHFVIRVRYFLKRG